MKLRSVFILLAFVFVHVACQSDAHKPLVEPVTDTAFPINRQKGGTFTSLKEIRDQAEALIKFRIEQNPKAMAMLTYAYWFPEVAFDNGKFSDPDTFKGYWLKLNDDFTYIFGQYDKPHGSGRYFFRLEDNNLIMLDDNPAFEPKVWQAKNNGEAMIFVGQHDFGINNGMQIKMIPLDERPRQS